MRAVDAQVLVRLLARDEPEQVAAADAFVSRGAWVSHLVLAEAVWLLVAAYERDPEAIAVAVDMLLGHAQLTVQDPDVVAAALERFRSRPGLAFTDCLAVEAARKGGHLPVGTFDRDLGRLAGVQKL